MKQLSKKQILGSDGETLVLVYDGDVEYVSHYKYKNYPEYKTSEGKRYKTRNYNQWLAMTHRTNPTSKNYEHVNTYIGASLEDCLKDFDSWCEWAETQVGYMCTTENNRLWQVDKDLKGDGKKTYSRETITFLPNWLNSGIAKREGDSHIAMRKFYQRVYNEFFDIFDDSTLEALFDKSAFNYGLNTEVRKTAIEFAAEKEHLLRINEVSSIVANLYCWDDLNDPYQGVKFDCGNYVITSIFRNKRLNNEKFDNIRDAVLKRIDLRISVVSEIEEMFKGSEIFAQKNYQDKVFEVKFMLDSAKYHWSDTDNKLLQWIQVEV